MKKVIIAFLLSNAAFAHASNSFDNIRFGVQGTQVKSNSFGSYFGERYNPSESKDLGGFYFSGSLDFGNNLYTSIDLTSVTRASTDLDNHFIGLGHHHDFGFNSFYVTAGANKVKTVRHHSSNQESKFNEVALGFEAGAKFQLSSFYAIQPQYRISFFDKGEMHDYRLNNEIMLTDLFSLEASVGYNKFRDAEQFNWQGGVKFSF
ncbi:hypothetical protein [uncultured Photobacterium sp.]|uniref:hypothetical protein n=1 Tax=uncultured Photobacterium sp. TaxID=173973 RepID=UPI0026201B16|nr:hypothetical protein [uncultured Photobacterium sp.]